MYRDSSVRIVTGWTAGVRFPAEAKIFSLFHSVHTGSGTHLASYSPVLLRLRMVELYVHPPIRLYSVMLIKHRDKFTLPPVLM
jgi:hypothetical protein